MLTPYTQVYSQAILKIVVFFLDKSSMCVYSFSLIHVPLSRRSPIRCTVYLRCAFWPFSTGRRTDTYGHRAVAGTLRELFPDVSIGHPHRPPILNFLFKYHP